MWYNEFTSNYFVQYTGQLIYSPRDPTLEGKIQSLTEPAKIKVHALLFLLQAIISYLDITTGDYTI